jgi:predicted ATPase
LQFSKLAPNCIVLLQIKFLELSGTEKKTAYMRLSRNSGKTLLCMELLYPVSAGTHGRATHFKSLMRMLHKVQNERFTFPIDSKSQRLQYYIVHWNTEMVTISVSLLQSDTFVGADSDELLKT